MYRDPYLQEIGQRIQTIQKAKKISVRKLVKCVGYITPP
jgi:hypothetical protein